MPDLLIKEAELQKLDQIIAPIPTQFGLPLVNFFTQVSIARQQEAQQEAKKITEGLTGKPEAKLPERKKVEKTQ